MPAPPYPDLSGMTAWDAAELLRQLKFTAAKEWRRPLWIDREMRDMLVKALHKTFPRPHDLEQEGDKS